MNGKDLILNALNCNRADKIPIWFMRQAGRYLPEYLELRKGKTFEEMCQTPEIAKEITVQPINRFDLDAAIIFSDILVPIYSMNLGLSIKPGIGPEIEEPIRKPEDIKNLTLPDPKRDYPYLEESINLVKKDLNGKALIGFSGAPFTLASYLIEGKSTRDALVTKAFALTYPDSFHYLMKFLVKTVVTQLQVQINAGVDVIQLFDTWAGHLSQHDYNQWVLPYTTEVLQSDLLSSVPSIHFARGAGHLLNSFVSNGATALSIDTSLDLKTASKMIPDDIAIQGNLDPATLLSSPKVVEREVDKILIQIEEKNGYIFNLGKGIDKSSPLENVQAMINTVRSYSYN
ncbi:MAG: Uroporphyrinogen decarboxylase [Candidatus Heimdallarchaeota archaeon LC_3]|nr:MAG: Uroporphyrinogen decarboxylase [Candidatus Heimdallarchaeota archaeon LC_3]